MGVMLDRIKEQITDHNLLREGFVIHDGFVFIPGQTNSPIFDRLLIRIPQRARSDHWEPGYSCRTLEEHIALINELNLEKVKLICADISFLQDCPSLKDISVSPSLDASSNFSYESLYCLSGVTALACQTQYGDRLQYQAPIDYSRFSTLEDLEMVGEGHIGFEQVRTLKRLWISSNKSVQSFCDISCSPNLEDVTIMRCGIKSLCGIEQFPKLKSLACYHNRSLQDISALKYAALSLEDLTIEASTKIQDFTVFSDLVNLRFLCLSGSNTLPDVDFLERMPHLLLFNCNMKIGDGDLRNCLSVAYATCKNFKHYNLKDADLPKDSYKIRDYLGVE